VERGARGEANMRWLLKRALLLWLALIALCAAGVGIGKLDHTPNALLLISQLYTILNEPETERCGC